MPIPIEFSALVTSYNYRRYLGEAIQSATAQTLAPREILVIDDGSTDGSAAWAREHFAADPRVRVIEQENGGQLGAFARGIREARGTVVAFLDADDRWHPDYLARVAAVLEARPSVDFVYANLRYHGASEGQFHRENSPRDDGISMLQGAFGPMWRGSPTSAISIRLPMARRLAEVTPELLAAYRTRADDCLTQGADVLAAHKYYLGQVLVDYRDHGGNAWLNRECSEADRIRQWARTLAMITHYRRLAGLDAADRPYLLRNLKREFLAKPQPTRRELDRYSELLDDAALGFLRRWRDRLRMHRHYRASPRARTSPD